MTPPAVEVRDLTKAYRTGWWSRTSLAALDRVDFTVSPGEGVAIVGPNGAGKSTLLAILSGLRHPTDGRVRIFGQDPRLPQTRATIGALPDRPALYPELDALGHLRLVAAAHDLARAEVRIAEVLGRLDLGRARGLARTLSAGMQKRLALALALLPSPRVLLLDEPMAALDPESVRIVADALAEERTRGVTLLVATHRLTDLVGCCDRVVQVRDGAVQRMGSVESVLVRLPVRVVYTLPPGASEPKVGSVEPSPAGLSIRVAPANRRDALVEQIRQAGGAVLRVSPMLDLLETTTAPDVEETLA